MTGLSGIMRDLAGWSREKSGVFDVLRENRAAFAVSIVGRRLDSGGTRQFGVAVF